jgi:plasmid maintenance system antidote protein VapI
MTGRELASRLDRLDISRLNLATMLGVTERSVERWVSERHPIPPMVASVVVLARSSSVHDVVSFIRARE